MANRYASLATAPIPQSAPLDARQVPNHAGGFGYALDDWARLDRFLILGSDSNTYYQSARKLTKENAACVARCYAADPLRTIARIVEISQAGRAAKNDAAIFALALGTLIPDARMPEDRVRPHVYAALPKVCRTATHLFQFVNTTTALGKGWGKGMKRAVADWYAIKSPNALAYQMIKYREREGQTHARVIERARATRDRSRDPARRALYGFAKGKLPPGFPTQQAAIDALPILVQAHLRAMEPGVGTAELCQLIDQHRLPWEAIPTAAKKTPEVWHAMLPHLGLTALIRSLGAMTACGALVPLGPATGIVVHRLGDAAELRKARVHPFNILVARAIYAAGKPIARNRTTILDDGTEITRAQIAWTPIPAILDALEQAYYLAFETVLPTGQRTLIGLDVSRSMSTTFMNSPLTVCEGAAAMAMVTMRAEQQWHVMAFDQGIRDLGFTARTDLAGVLAKTRNINGGGTDCALPMLYAAQNKLDVDVFQVITDNETWAGRVHPVQALRDYRQKSGIAAKLVVMGMTATDCTIADPEDPGMLDVVGFDSAAPALIADFARGQAAPGVVATATEDETD